MPPPTPATTPRGTLAGTNGNLSVDPRFVAANDDGDGLNNGFALALRSPLLDAGDPGLTDPDGSRSDVGAYGGAAGGW